MLIVINALAPAAHSNAKAIHRRILQLSVGWASLHPEHHFWVIDNTLQTALNLPNVVTHIKEQQPTNWLMYKYWLDIQLPLLLRKKGVSVIIQPYGFTSTTLKCAQIVLVDGVVQLLQPHLFNKATVRFYQLFAKASFSRARQIGVFSPQVFAEVGHVYPSCSGKMVLLPPVTQSILTPISLTQKEVIKTAFTDGCEYFLYMGSLDVLGNIIVLLKAFSLFKKRQKSNMKLVIIGNTATMGRELAEKLATYKYKDAVVILAKPIESEMTQITSAAYAVVLAAIQYPFADTLLDILQSGVPVIIGKNIGWENMLQEAVVYAEMNDAENVAQHMIALYKNETLRMQYCSSAQQQAKKVASTPQQQQALLWNLFIAPSH